MEQYILTCDEVLKQKLVKEVTDSYIQNKIQQWVYTFFKHPVPKYTASMIPSEIDSFIYDELTNKRAEILISVMDYSRRANKFTTTVDKKFILKDNNVNHLYYFKEYETILSEYNFLGDTFRLFYAENDEKFMKFVSYFNKQNRRLNLGKIDFYSDAKNGINMETKKVERTVLRENVFLDTKIKEELYHLVDTFFEEPDFYYENDIPYKRGVILYGKPGNGKTTLIKSLVSSLNAPVVYYQISELTTSQNIERVFNNTLNKAPAVLVMEDIDSMPKNCRSSFLNLLDGAVSNEGLFIIGTTNYPEEIDPGIMNRAGRFDKSYEVSLPNADVRTHFFTQKLAKFSFDIPYLVKQTERFSLAQLAELTTQILLKDHYGQEVVVDELINEFKGVNKKQEKNNWNTETPSVGFVIRD